MENIINDKLFTEAQQRIQNLVGGDVIDQNTLIKLYENLTPSNAKNTIDIINKMCFDAKRAFDFTLLKITGSTILTGAAFFGLTYLTEKIFLLNNNIYINHAKMVSSSIMLVGFIGLFCIGH